MVATIEASAVRLQIPAVGPFGNRLSGGHWRVSGAQALAAAGVLAHVVTPMGRWNGPTVKRYVAGAPPATSYNLAPGLRSARSTRNVLSDLSVETAQTEADVALLRAEVAKLGADLTSEATKPQVAIRRAESVDDPALPVNDATWIENSRRVD